MKVKSTLKYPNKSHRKIVILPDYSPKLAEFFGIMIGDGGINNPWQVTITLNSIKDKEYSNFIKSLCFELFGIYPAIRKRPGKNTLVISLASISVVEFLIEKDLPRGNKLKNGLKIPDWILFKKSYQIACVRGLVDTDGCLFIHQHIVKGKAYKNLGLCFTNHSPGIIKSVAAILKELGISGHISKRGSNVYLYRESDIVKYLKIVGTSNDRISSLYNEWRDARVV